MKKLLIILLLIVGCQPTPSPFNKHDEIKARFSEPEYRVVITDLLARYRREQEQRQFVDMEGIEP